MLTREEKEDLVRRVVEELWSRGRLDVADEAVDEDYVGYIPNPPEEIHGRESLKEMITVVREPMPDLVKHIERITVSDNMVMVGYSETRNENADVDSQEIQGVMIYRIENGRIVEGIDFRDTYDILREFISF